MGALPTFEPPTVNVTVPPGLMLPDWMPPGSWPDRSATMLEGPGSTASVEPDLSTICEVEPLSARYMDPSAGSGVKSALTLCSVTDKGTPPGAVSTGLVACPLTSGTVKPGS